VDSVPAVLRIFAFRRSAVDNITVAEVEHIVEPGELNPDEIHALGVFVQRLFEGQTKKIIEQRTTRVTGSTDAEVLIDTVAESGARED
jgi:hypothetical protein